MTTIFKPQMTAGTRLKGSKFVAMLTKMTTAKYICTPKKTAFPIDEVLELANQGYTMTQISDMLFVSESAVRNNLKKAKSPLTTANS